MRCPVHANAISDLTRCEGCRDWFCRQCIPAGRKRCATCANNPYGQPEANATSANDVDIRAIGKQFRVSKGMFSAEDYHGKVYLHRDWIAFCATSKQNQVAIAAFGLIGAFIAYLMRDRTAARNLGDAPSELADRLVVDKVVPTALIILYRDQGISVTKGWLGNWKVVGSSPKPTYSVVSSGLFGKDCKEGFAALGYIS